MKIFVYVFVFQFFWAIGSVFTVAVAMAVMPTLGWRWLLGFLSLPLLIFVLMSYVSNIVLYKKFLSVAQETEKPHCQQILRSIFPLV